MKHILYKIFVIVSLFCLICCKDVYADVIDVPAWELEKWVFENKDGVDTDLIVKDLQTYLNYTDDHLYNLMKFNTTITVTKTGEGRKYWLFGELRNKYSVKIGTGEGKCSYLDDKVSVKQLKKNFGIEDPDPKAKAKEGKTWTYDAIIYCMCWANGLDSYGMDATGALDVTYYLQITKLWTEPDLKDGQTFNDYTPEIIDLQQGPREDGLNRLDELPGDVADIAKDIATSFLPDWARDFLDHPFESILDILLWVIRGIGDFFQILANFAQTPLDGDASHFGVTYTYDELISQGLDGAANKYTRVSEYKEDDVVEGTTIPAQNIPLANEDNDSYGFTEDTRIPVIKVDLYTMGANKVGLLDANFLDPDSMEHGSIWLKLRNFIVPFIYAMLYITAACLISTLIWHGIQIVRSSITSPEKRKEHIEGLQKFAVSVILLVGVIVIEALCIYASNLFLEDVTGVNNESELPIRVNVEETYSFSTNPTGYCRYMSEIENLDLNLIKIKAVYTFGYLILALFNCAFMLIMFLRMLAMMLLAVVGYIIVLINLFSKESSSNWRFKDWVMLYVGIAFLQVFLALVSRIMFKTCF